MHKVAIVEDAADNRELLYYLLRDDFEVTRYGTGEEALRDIPKEPPDLIILDIWLEGMDGVEVLKRLRQIDRLRNVPVIAWTANAMPGDRAKYLAAGFDEYVTKPVIDMDEFIATIRRLLGKSGRD